MDKNKLFSNVSLETYTIPLFVNEPTTNPTVLFEKEKLELFLGETTHLEKIINVLYTDLNFSSSNTTIATVDSLGNVAALSAGTVDITCSFKYDGVTYSNKISATVKSPSLYIDATLIEIYLGQKFALKAVTSPIGQPIVWKSENNNVATVDAEGVVTGKNEGRIDITGEFLYKGKTYSGICDLMVISPSIVFDVSDVSNTTNQIVMYIGDTYYIPTSTAPTSQKIFWVSSEPEIASVFEDGNILALSLGEEPDYYDSTNKYYVNEVTITGGFIYEGLVYSQTCKVLVVDTSK